MSGEERRVLQQTGQYFIRYTELWWKGHVSEFRSYDGITDILERKELFFIVHNADALYRRFLDLAEVIMRDPEEHGFTKHDLFDAITTISTPKYRIDMMKGYADGEGYKRDVPEGVVKIIDHDVLWKKLKL